MTSIRHGGQPGLRTRMRSAEREGNSVVFHATGGRMVFATGLEGGCGRIPAQGVAKPLSSEIGFQSLNRPGFPGDGFS